ncbi:phospholipid carrier-dependent glycosyltransferase [Patescibacteria group bacterium]|nr:phospholipid carrier-dependent glycosyltransferase [Patescibacteria group bacterium]
MRSKLFLILIVVLGLFLRFYRLGDNPPSLYWDEASLGYNAYSIAATLHDEHGVFLPHDAFAAFGDYKPVGYIYAVVPFVKLLGLTEIAVRLPSAIAGILLIIVSYLIVVELSKNRKWALLTALFIAISPWSLQMSRAAFEANLATLFSGLGVYLFLKAIRGKTIFFLLSSIFFAAAMYTFNSHRVFVPLLVLALSFIYIKDILRMWKKSWVFFLTAAILLIPLVPHLLSPEGRLRFNEVAWVNDLSIVEAANKNIASNNNALWAKLVYNRRILYGEEFLRHYFDHYRFNFLFQTGDINPRLSTQAVGEMYLFDFPLVLLGIYALLRKRNKIAFIIFIWLLLGPIPAATARETPHALRTLNLLPVPQIISALGLLALSKRLRLVLTPILAVLVFLYLQNYYFVYPTKYSGDWQYGYKQMVRYVATVQKDYDYIDVTNHYGRPYIYFLFYNQYDPEKYWQNRDASRDQFGFWTVSCFDKYHFDTLAVTNGKGLFVVDPQTKLPGRQKIKTIYDPNNQPVFDIYD